LMSRKLFFKFRRNIKRIFILRRFINKKRPYR
jgi:hypothetical protein